MKQNKNNIPEGWQKVTLRQCVDIDSNSLSEKTVDNKEFFYIDLSAVSAGVITFPKEKVSFRNAPSRARRIIHKGDIIFSTVRPYLKGFALIDFDSDDYIVSTGFSVLTSKNNFSNKYIYHYLFSENFQKQIFISLLGSSFPALNSKDVKSLSILIPISITEQQKIVEVLETWDKAIQLTRKLIEQKELQKKYLMQQLLTGRTRLKGFVTPWKTERLGHFKSIIIEKGTALSSQNIEKGPIPVIAGGQTVPYYHKYWTHDVPCITISASGAYAGFVWLHSGKIWASDCSVIYTRGYDLNFLYYCLKSQQNHLFYLQTGGAQAHIYPSEIRSLKIPNISLQEQQAIVQLLNINFQEIDLLCQKLAKLEEQKKGLMQVLLTGKVRIPLRGGIHG